MAEDEPDPYNEGQFQTGDDTGIYSTGNGTTGDPNVDDYKGWDWKQLKAAVNGYSASNDDVANANAASNVDPSTLRYAGSAFQHAHDTMDMISKSLLDQAEAVAGENGPWTGAGAQAFLAKMYTLAELIEANAERIAGGDSAAAANSVPNQLIHSGNVLAWAQNRLNYIDNYYAAWARKLGADVVDKLTHVSQIPGLPERITNDMMLVVDQLADQYKVTFGAVGQPDPVVGGGGDPPPPPVLDEDDIPEPDPDDIPDPDPDPIPDPDDIPDPDPDQIPDPDDIPDPSGDDVPDPTADDIPDPSALNEIPDPTSQDIPDPTGQDVPEMSARDVPPVESPGGGDFPAGGSGGGGPNGAGDIPPLGDLGGPGGPAGSGGGLPPGAIPPLGGGIPPLGGGIPPVGGPAPGSGNNRPGANLPGSNPPSVDDIPPLDSSRPGGVGGGGGLGSGPGGVGGGAGGGSGIPAPGTGDVGMPPAIDPTTGLPTAPGGIGGGAPGGVGGGLPPGLGAGGMPPMTPGPSPQGSSAPDRSDASGLLGEVEEPWKPGAVGGAPQIPAGGAMPGAGGIPPMSPAQSPQGSGAPERSDASGLLGDVEEPWLPGAAGGSPQIPAGGALPGAGGIPPMSPAQTPQGSGAPERSDASGLLGEVEEPWLPGAAGGSPQVPAGGAMPAAGGVPPMSPAQTPQGSAAPERSDASGLLEETGEPWAPAATGDPALPAGGTAPGSPGTGERVPAPDPFADFPLVGAPGAAAPLIPPMMPPPVAGERERAERSQASELLGDVSAPWEATSGAPAEPGAPSGRTPAVVAAGVTPEPAAMDGREPDEAVVVPVVVPVVPQQDLPPQVLAPWPAVVPPRREAAPRKPEAAELLREETGTWGGATPSGDYVPVVRRDETAEDTSAWGGEWLFPNPNPDPNPNPSVWNSGRDRGGNPHADGDDAGWSGHATWRPAKADPGQSMTIEPVAEEEGASGGVRPLTAEELEARRQARIAAREERLRQELERISPPPAAAEEDAAAERSAADLLRQDDGAWGGGRSAPGVIG